jgi:hypothetical protein
VQGDDFAIGIQALNPKTLGGYPWQENDCLPQIDIIDQDDPSDLSEEGKRYVLYRVEAAKPTVFGSSIQAYCRDRSKERIISNLNHERYIAPAFDDGGFIGSKIALFACPNNEALEMIGKIEIAENLPHPLIDGEWGKTSRVASSAYIIMNFGRKDIEKAIAITKKAGLKYLYFSGPFVNWGHFDLDKEHFPKGYESMKECVDIAEKNGVKLGLHTLSNFITTNDPYVTPIPDKRLAKVGTSMIVNDIDEEQSEILIKSPDFFNQYKNNSLKTVIIDDELIRYARVSEIEPWTLLNCQRGAFGTKPSAHSANQAISKLADHAYNVFLTNAELTMELAKNIANLYNETGLRQISFDGIEGNRSTGMGNYGEILFAKTWYDHLDENIKEHFIADASRTTHYFWHIYSRMNWGEPWYAGFRESQTEYRIKNQAYFKRNLMPNMLGWFQMTAETSLEDIEWLLARSAAFDAGYAFVTNFETVEKNAQADKILNLIKNWEEVRMAGLFSDEQKQKMENLDYEFTLEKVDENQWNLIQVYSAKFKHKKKIRQPGEPLYSTFEFKHQGAKQNLGFIISASNSDIYNIEMEIDHYKKIELPITLKAGEIIKYSSGHQASVYNKNWQLIKTFEIDAKALSIEEGDHSLTIDCKFSNAKDDAFLKIETRTFGQKQTISR